MTDVDTAQEQIQGNQQTPFAKEETNRNVAQQLPNTDPISTETNDWGNQDRDTVDWGAFNYYNWAIPMGYWGNNPEAREKGKEKGEHSGDGKSVYPKRRSGGVDLC